MAYSFERLNRYLMDLPDEDECMLLEELDGFLAGVLACPDVIPPSQWLPHIWRRKEGLGPEDGFKDMDEANRVLGLIMEHYNEIARSLMPESREPYQPVVSLHKESGEEICFFWLLGFEQALKAWPESWMKVMLGTETGAQEALTRLRSLIKAVNAKEEDFTEDQMVLLVSAPDEISELVVILSLSRLVDNPVLPITRHQAFKNVGRNDPCPCGSGRKYKKCHGAN